MRIALLGCGKQKSALTVPASEMYRSALFRAAVRYALFTCDRYYILSAKHGLLDPEKVIEPYELSLASLDKSVREAWGRKVGKQLDKAVPELDAEIIVLAGKHYSDLIDPPRDFYWAEPLTGLGVGERIAWLKERSRFVKAGRAA